MPRVLLIHGSPGAGKSTLGRTLRDRFGWHQVCLDTEYPQFMEKHCPGLYFPWMGAMIFQHYTHIASDTNTTKRWFHRDACQEWHDHLKRISLDAVDRHDKVAIVGWLLEHRRPELLAALQPRATVHEIHVTKRSPDGRLYTHVSGNLTVEQIDGLT